MTSEQQLEALLARAFGKVRDSGKWYRIPCPTCETKDRAKCKRYVNKQYRSSHCFICQIKLTLPELLGDDADVILPMSRQEIVDQPVKVLHPWAKKMPVKKSIPIHELPASHPAIRFLHKDHLFDLERYYKENGIVYCPADGGVIIYNKPFVSSAERLIFPVYLNKELVGWQMRAIPGTTFGDHKECLRYCHLFEKGNYLYNYDNAKQFETVVLVEGVKKTLKFHNAVASLGKGISDVQVQLLLLNWKNIIVMLDGDDKTQVEALKLAKLIKENGRKVVNVDPRQYGFPSPDEATEEQCEDMLLDVVSNNFTEYGEHT